MDVPSGPRPQWTLKPNEADDPRVLPNRVLITKDETLKYLRRFTDAVRN